MKIFVAGTANGYRIRQLVGFILRNRNEVTSDVYHTDVVYILGGRHEEISIVDIARTRKIPIMEVGFTETGAVTLTSV